MEIAAKLIQRSNLDENPIDTHYKELHTDIVPIEKGDDDWNLVHSYMQNTHALLEVFKVERYSFIFN
jgi:hypothetical protein